MNSFLPASDKQIPHQKSVNHLPKSPQTSNLSFYQVSRTGNMASSLRISQAQ